MGYNSVAVIFNCLWIGIYPPGEKERRVSMWIRARGKLSINAFED